MLTLLNLQQQQLKGSPIQQLLLHVGHQPITTTAIMKAGIFLVLGMSI